MLASNHLGYGIDLFQENLYFVNCRREYKIRPLRVIPDSTNQLAALALKLNLKLNFLSNVEVPEMSNKLEYDAAIQSMRNSTPPTRRDQRFLCFRLRISLVFGNGRRRSLYRKAEHFDSVECDGGLVSE